MTRPTFDVSRAGVGRSVFERVVVGVDGTEPSFEACRQALRLAEPDTPIEAVAVVHLADAIHAGVRAAAAVDRLQREAETALEQATTIIGDRARTRFVNGYVADALLHEAEAAKATLLALGSHGHRRSTEILIGGPAGDILHRATCSVLVARPPSDPVRFPGPIAVGVDGSDQSWSALAVGESLAARFGAPLRIVVARGGKGVDLERVRRELRDAEEVDLHPTDALVRAAHGSGLIVVGSRGLHGFRALGSVSERVAHQAPSSVLVVHAASGA